jgi:predicted adenine nucleotide alpha hydrolase (AANH) superfamily ATPase
MKAVLHLCCANCAIFPLKRLRADGYEVRGLFFNPNIHPFQEFARRREAVERLSAAMEFPVIFLDQYPLEEFLRRVAFRESERCQVCYQWRMEKAAEVARRGRYDVFTTTLLFSKQQQHERVRQIAQNEAAIRGVPFLYEDFRLGWEEGNRVSREMGLYRQSYCGCVYSERDRFAPNRGKTIVRR